MLSLHIFLPSPRDAWGGVREADGGVMEASMMTVTPPSPYDGDTSPTSLGRRAYLKYAQRMSWPLPIGLKRMPPTLAA